MSREPIFIGGPDRCGKTSLRACLVSHPNISIPAVGSNMWTYFYGQYGDLRHDENLERCLAALLHYKHVRYLRPDPERLRREFALGRRTYGRLFGLIHQHHAEREGKPRWGDQTGLIERYADAIFEEFPRAKMLHMVRDPRDRYHASLELWPSGRGRVGGATARWLYSVRLARRNQRLYPERYLIVQFEELVCQPEMTLRRVCDFLGEDFVPGMIAMDGAPEYRQKRSAGRDVSPGESPLSESFIGRYRGAIPAEEIAFMQRMARHEMATFGYAPDELELSAAARLHLAVRDYPLNTMRFIAWRSLEALQHRLPHSFGRRPDPRMMLNGH